MSHLLPMCHYRADIYTRQLNILAIYLFYVFMFWMGNVLRNLHCEARRGTAPLFLKLFLCPILHIYKNVNVLACSSTDKMLSKKDKYANILSKKELPLPIKLTYQFIHHPHPRYTPLFTNILAPHMRDGTKISAKGGGLVMRHICIAVLQQFMMKTFCPHTVLTLGYKKTMLSIINEVACQQTPQQMVSSSSVACPHACKW